MQPATLTLVDMTSLNFAQGRGRDGITKFSDSIGGEGSMTKFEHAELRVAHELLERRQGSVVDVVVALAVDLGSQGWREDDGADGWMLGQGVADSTDAVAGV